MAVSYWSEGTSWQKRWETTAYLAEPDCTAE